MAFGTLVKDALIVPIPQGYVPGDGFRALQSSQLKYTDGSSNVSTGAVTSDSKLEAVLNGQVYGVLYTQTIGGAAQGQYCLSVFNPSGSGITVVILSIKTMVNYGNTTTWTYLNTADPAYNQNLSSVIVNHKGGGATSALGSHVTANSASTSFPSSGNVDMATSTPEVVPNGLGYCLPPNNGCNVLVFVGNSQEYAIAVKWAEV